MTPQVSEQEAFVNPSAYDHDIVVERECKFLSFPLADTMYGIDIKNVLEVVIFGSQIKITNVPHLPSFTRGIINLRGKIIPVIDLRVRFQLDEIAYDGRSCIIVVSIHGVTTGLIVDTVAGVVSIPESEVDPAPELDESAQSKFISGIGKTDHDVYILLETETLLHEKEFEALKKAGDM